MQPRLVRATTPTTTSLVTVPRVELLEVGEDWQTSTGLFTWTEEDLLSAVESQADPGVRTPVLKLGHNDERFDGQPSFGRVEGLTIVNNGQTLIGDLVGVPVWLAECMPSAYPRRSIEGWFAWTTKTGNVWPFVLTGLALLGAFYPAITTLEDLTVLWGSEAPPMVAADGSDDQVAAKQTDDGMLIRARKVIEVPKWLKRAVEPEVAASAETPTTTEEEVPKPKGQQVQAAAVSMDDVRMAFYDSLDQGQYWWWIRQVLVNPLQLVVDNDEGSLFLIDVTVSGEAITFGEPSEVKVEYVAASGVVLAQQDQIIANTFASASEAGAHVKEEPTPAPSAEDEEAHDVNLSDDALRALGLEPGATEEQINQAIVEKSTTTATTPGEGEEQEASTEEETTEEETTEEEQETPAPNSTTTTTVPDGMVLVDSAQWAQTQEGVAAALRMDKEAKQQDRDNTIAAAVKAGKFPKARVAHYTALWDADPEGTRNMISALAAGVVPVEEVGRAGESEANAEQQSYPASWQSKAKAAQARPTNRVKVVND